MISICSEVKREEGQEGQEERSTYSIRRICGLDTRSIKEESDGGGSLSLPFAEGVHQLLQLCCALDLEKNFVVVIRDLYVEVLRLLRFLRLVRGWGPIVVRRHSEDKVKGKRDGSVQDIRTG